MNEVPCNGCGAKDLHLLNYCDQFQQNPLMACATCGHAQVVPIPSQAVVTGYYTNLYSKQRENYVDVRYLRIMERRAEAQWGMITPIPRNVLDIGCGYGAFLAKAQSLGIDAMGIDFDPRAIEYCRARRFPCELFRSELEILNFLRSREPDFIIMSHVLEHFLEPATILNACTHTRIFIEVPKYRVDCCEQFVNQEGHLNFFSHRSLLALLRRTEFTVEAFGAFGPSMDFFWRRHWEVSRRILRFIIRDYFFHQYSTIGTNGIWLRALVRGKKCKS
jgi:SAM-dependent methyltransferase